MTLHHDYNESPKFRWIKVTYDRRRELPDLSANFSTEDLKTALLAVKSGKGAGFDGVYPEFIKSSGQKMDRRPF
jgi:hypothetical protein